MDGARRRARRVHAGDDQQLLVRDDDPLGGVPVGRHDQGDRLADVVDLAAASA